MRKKLSLVLYMVFVEAIAVYLVVFPVYAFQVSSSTTGYVRVASQAAVVHDADGPTGGNGGLIGDGDQRLHGGVCGRAVGRVVGGVAGLGHCRGHDLGHVRVRSEQGGRDQSGGGASWAVVDAGVYEWVCRPHGDARGDGGVHGGVWRAVRFLDVHRVRAVSSCAECVDVSISNDAEWVDWSVFTGSRNDGAVYLSPLCECHV